MNIYIIGLLLFTILLCITGGFYYFYTKISSFDEFLKTLKGDDSLSDNASEHSTQMSDAKSVNMEELFNSQMLDNINSEYDIQQFIDDSQENENIEEVEEEDS